MFTNDYIMRQIEMLSKAVGHVFFKKDLYEEMYEEMFSSLSESEELRRLLKSLVLSGRYCEAEDKLFFYLENHPDEDILEIAIEFYALLNQKSDDDLQANNFSRQEIGEGLKSIEKLLATQGKNISPE